MKIVADRDIYQVEEYFSSYGELVLLPGREIRASHVKDAQALLVRTVTKIDQRLVQGSSLQFIGSATSGLDHLDSACLEENNIHFTHAPGCNADAVVNYVVAALVWLSEQAGFDWRQKSLGIVGAGHVGGRLGKVAATLGMPLAIHDPFLEASHPLAAYFAPLNEVLGQDVVSLHVPLTTGKNHPTVHLLNANALGLLKTDAILLNAARGEVIDNNALLDHLVLHPDQKVVLDVWEGEPAINQALAQQVAIATPHIAGYSLNGKRNGTQAIYQEFCTHFAMDPHQASTQKSRTLILPETLHSGSGLLNKAMLQAYPINRDFLATDEHALAGMFDERRNNYPFRAEFRDYSFNPVGIPEDIAFALATLGFTAKN